MSLTFHWQLENNIIDSVQNKRAIEHGTLSYAKAKLGNGLSLDGTANTGAELLQHADADPLQNSNHSVSLWFESQSTAGSSGARVITRDVSDYFGIVVNQSGSFPQDMVIYYDKDSNTGWVSNYVTQGDLINVIFSYRISDNEVDIYIGGDLLGTYTWSGWSGSSRPIVLGGNTEGDGDISGTELIGLIDDVRFYDHAVSKKEAKEIARAKLLHYKFDVFSEWTENLASDVEWVEGNSNQIAGGTTPPTISYDGTVSYGGGGSGKTVWQASGTAWGDMNVQFTNTSITIPDGETYTWSAYVIGDSGLEVSYRLTGDTGVGNVNIIHDGTWKKIEMSYTNTSGTSVQLGWYAYSPNQAGSMWIDNVQVEPKDHATPFTRNTRNAIVRDSSYQHNDAELDSNTPQWVEDSAVGKGAYFFDGTNYTVSYKDLSLTGSTPFSILAWYRGSGSLGTILSLNYNTSPLRGIDLITDGGTIETHIISTWDTDAIKVSSDPNGASYLPVNDGNWNLVGLTYDGSKSASGVKIYINSVLQENIVNVNTLTSDTILYPGHPIRIGGRTDGNGNLNLPVSGDVDSPQVYSYELSQSEIEQIYKQRASIDSEGSLYGHNFQEPEDKMWFNLSDEYPVVSSTYNVLTTTTGDTLVDQNYLDWVESDDTLGNIFLEGWVYVSDTTWYPTTFEFTKLNNDQGFYFYNANHIVNGGDGWHIGWNHLVNFSPSWDNVASTPWSEMDRLQIYRSGTDTGDSADYIQFRDLRVRKYSNNISVPNNFNITSEGKLQVDKSVEVTIPRKNNILDYTTWTPGTWGSQTGFGQISSGESRIDYMFDPFEKAVPTWVCIPGDTSDADGGWNTDLFSIDYTKTYRSVVWVKRTGSNNGSTYHGCYDLLNLDGSANGNPYFWSGDPPTLDEWYLLVGIMHPNGYAGGDTGVSGVYDRKGNKILDGTEYQLDTSGNQRQRAYLFYCTDTSVRQYFVYPRFELVDGTEPTIQQLVNGYDSREYYSNSIIQNKNKIISARSQLKEV